MGQLLAATIGLGVIGVLWGTRYGASPQPRQPVLISFVDTIQDFVPVSGRLLASVMLRGVDTSESSRQLSVILPAAAADTICVRTTSYDGRYYARALFDVRGLGAGVHPLPQRFPSARYQNSYKARQLGVVVRAGARCDAVPDGTEVYAAAWGVPDFGTLDVVLNGAGQHIRLGMKSGKRRWFVDCKRLVDVRPVAGDSRCVLALQPFKPDSILIQRFDFEHALLPIVLPLRVP